MSRNRGTARATGGFTLVELMLSLALSGLVMALTLPVLAVQKRLWERREAGREAARTLLGAVAWVTRDLQQAGYHVPGPPVRRLETAAIAYVLSRDEEVPSAFSAENRRLVTLYLDDGDLKYRIQAPLAPPAAGWDSGSVQVLAPGIAAMACRGMDRTGEVTTDAGRAAMVGCAFTAANGTEASTLVRLRVAPEGAP